MSPEQAAGRHRQVGRRYPTALAVAEELGRFQRNEPIQARPVGPVGRAWRWGRRNPRLAGVGGQQGGVSLWNLETREETLLSQPSRIQAFAAFSQGTNNTCLEFSSDGSTLFAGDESGEVRVWSVPREEILTRWRRSPDAISQLHGDRKSRRLVVIQNLKPPGVTRDFVGSFRVSVWNPWDRLEEKAWTIPQWIDCCALSPDGGVLAIAQPSGTIGLWDPVTLTKRTVLSLWGNLTDLGFSPDGRQFAAANAEGWIKIWNMKGLGAHFEFRALQCPVTAVAFSPDGRRLVSAGDGEEAPRLWDLATGQELLTLQRPGEVLKQVAFLAEGRQLVARTAEDNVLGWLVPSLGEIEAAEGRTTPPGSPKAPF